MRAGFLGQNICSLGFGVATLHTPPLVMDQPLPESPPDSERPTVDQHVSSPPVLPPFSDTRAVANSPRLTA
jgi:hypothetical protein